jgi:predicted N-acyltransferase
MRVRDRIRDVDAAWWDGLTGSCYSRTGWLAMLEGSFGGTVSYVSTAAAAAVCYVFGAGEQPAYDVERLLDLDGLRPALTVAAPGFANPLRWAPDRQHHALTELTAALLERSRDLGMRSTAMLYVDADPTVHGVLTEAGFIAAELEPNCVLGVRWSSCAAYLADLTSKHRADVRRNAGIFARSGLTATVRTGAGYGPELVRLAMNTRARYGLPADPAPFDESARYLREHLADDFVLFCAERGGRPVGFAMFQKYGRVLSADRVGFDYGATAGTSAYFELTYNAALRWAIEHGFQLIDYGTEAYEVKLRRGCELRGVRAYVRPADDRRDEVRRRAAEQDARIAELRRTITGVA